MSNKSIAVYAEAMKRQQEESEKPASNPAPQFTRNNDHAREKSSENSRDKSLGLSRELPTRDEIQEFNFRLRDDLKVKMQAEVPHEWRDELEQLANELRVKKLELYRYIIGRFLGKVKE